MLNAGLFFGKLISRKKLSRISKKDFFLLKLISKNFSVIELELIVFFFSYYSSKVDVINMMSNSNGLNITNVNNKNLRENQQQLANDLSKQTTNKSTLSTSVSSSSVSVSLTTMSSSSNSNR